MLTTLDKLLLGFYVGCFLAGVVIVHETSKRMKERERNSKGL